VKRERRTPAKQLGLEGFADDKILVAWRTPTFLGAVLGGVSPEAVQRAAESWGLTDGQREVLHLFCVEKVAKTPAIAERMGCSKRTVEKHFEFLFAASGQHSRAALALEVADFEPRDPPTTPTQLRPAI